MVGRREAGAAVLQLVRRTLSGALDLSKRIASDYNFWMVLGTWVLAFAAFITLKDSNDSLQRSQRAWVGPTSGKIEGAVTLKNPVVVSVNVINTGREPAAAFVPSVLPAIFVPATETEDALNAEIDGFVKRCRATPSKEGAQVLFPAVGLGNGFNFQGKYSKEKVDQGVIDGNKSLIVVGCLIYDTAGKTRHSTFCYSFKNGETKPDAMNLCFHGNTAD